jgi:hypothetical protein
MDMRPIVTARTAAKENCCRLGVKNTHGGSNPYCAIAPSFWIIRSSSAQTSAMQPEITMRPVQVGRGSASTTRTTRSGRREDRVRWLRSGTTEAPLAKTCGNAVVRKALAEALDG